MRTNSSLRSSSITASPHVDKSLYHAFAAYIGDHADDVRAYYRLPESLPVRIHIDARTAMELESDAEAVLTLCEKDIRGKLAFSTIAQWANGFVVVPMAHHLMLHGAFQVFMASGGQRDVQLAEILEALGVTAVRAVHGNIAAGMHLLCLDGWFTAQGRDMERSYRMTAQGRAFATLIEHNRDTVSRVVSWLHSAREFHDCVHQRSQQRDQLLRQYAALVALSQAGWDLAASPASQDHYTARFRVYLDAPLLCTTLVGFDMPVFRQDGDRIVHEHESLFHTWRQAAQDLDLASLPPGFDTEVVEIGMQLLAAQGLVELARSPMGTRVSLTPRGHELRDTWSYLAIPISYSRMYSLLGDMLLRDPDPLNMDEDRHVDRLANVYATGRFTPGVCRNINEQIVRKLFDETPLEMQPAGIADMGCGDGRPLRALGEYVIAHTRRGKHLDEYPFVLIGADYNHAARLRTRATLDSLAGVKGVKTFVIHGDVTRPDTYDAAIQALGVQIPDGRQPGNRLMRGDDLLHTMMFLAHDRELQKTSLADAEELLCTQVRTVDRSLLVQALRGCTDDGIAIPDHEDRLLAMVKAQFTACFSRKGYFVPGVVAAADYIDFLRRWAPLARHGLCLVEIHVPRPEDVAEPIPVEPGKLRKIDRLPHLMVWGLHYLSAQYTVPYVEHELAIALAGLSPVPGTTYAADAIDGSSRTRSISFACYQAR